MVFELPAALSLRLIYPNYAYGIAVILFGVFACCLSVAKSYAVVMILRLLIGLSEAYVQTGCVFLSLWYKRDELATRCGKQNDTDSWIQTELHSILLCFCTHCRSNERIDLVQC